MFIPRKVLEEKLRQMLAEDIGYGDVTSTAVISAGLEVEATVVTKEEGIAAGIEEIAILAESLGLSIQTEVTDGEEFSKGQILMKISGDARTILSAERTMLNLLSHMSGIATATRKLIEKLRNVGATAKIAATRKTSPGLNYFDKKAVLVGGGDPHRLRLDDMILVKENHLVIAGGVKNAVKKAKQNAPFSKKIEVEVTNGVDALKAAESGADLIMLDNFSPKQVKEAIGDLKNAGFLGKVLLEVSGGIGEQNLLEYASAQVDIISVGALTHSVRAIDISLEIAHVK